MSRALSGTKEEVRARLVHPCAEEACVAAGLELHGVSLRVPANGMQLVALWQTCPTLELRELLSRAPLLKAARVTVKLSLTACSLEERRARLRSGRC